ncbi:TonB family protein [Pseudooceanicola sp. CBS1P-1]|uniref:TonB family protein n=1 Tax=Pseudooceanicola albus TaxID=2692189 RepID=A0A6L7G3P5_9RHOB|nr:MULTISPECIES: TonB family protein [Pseudooceanicola]MBT9384939.1 TonB family protein [Pseudooceanicola endophyticus]MXN18066.1 TonB family protein [Pseudooceanicola albus]
MSALPRRLAEGAVFLTLAVGLHVALAIRLPAQDTGSDAGGQGGDALVSLKGAAPGTIAMVQQWETPPETTQQVEPVPQDTPPPTPVTTPQPDAPPPAMPQLDLAAQQPDTVALPKIETEVPPPPQPDPPPVAEAPPEPEPEPQPQEEVAEAQPDSAAPTEARRPMPRPQDLAPEPQKKPEKAVPGPVTQAARKGGEGGVTQRAAGSGGSAQAGNSSGSVRTGKGKEEARLEAVWGAKIRGWIERKKRFPGAMRGSSGRVVVRLTVAPDGRLLGASVVRSSGEAAFDQAALSAVQRAGRMPKAPAQLKEASYSFNLPVDFS